MQPTPAPPVDPAAVPNFENIGKRLVELQTMLASEEFDDKAVLSDLISVCTGTANGCHLLLQEIAKLSDFARAADQQLQVSQRVSTALLDALDENRTLKAQIAQMAQDLQQARSQVPPQPLTPVPPAEAPQPPAEAPVNGG